MRLLTKLKLELPYDPAGLLLGLYLKESKSVYNEILYSHVTFAAPFTIAKVMNPVSLTING
jgi:hypothetical protein